MKNICISLYIFTIKMQAFLYFLPCICCERLAEVGAAGAETGGSAEQDAGSSGVRSPT